MHVEDSGGVDAGAEEDEFFLDVSRQDIMCRLDGGSHGGTRKRRGIGVCGLRLEEQQGEFWLCLWRFGLGKGGGCGEVRGQQR